MEEFTISPGQYLIATCSLIMSTALAGYHAKQDGKTGLAWITDSPVHLGRYVAGHCHSGLLA